MAISACQLVPRKVKQVRMPSLFWAPIERCILNQQPSVCLLVSLTCAKAFLFVCLFVRASQALCGLEAGGSAWQCGWGWGWESNRVLYSAQLIHSVLLHFAAC